MFITPLNHFCINSSNLCTDKNYKLAAYEKVPDKVDNP